MEEHASVLDSSALGELEPVACRPVVTEGVVSQIGRWSPCSACWPSRSAQTQTSLNSSKCRAAIRGDSDSEVGARNQSGSSGCLGLCAHEYVDRHRVRRMPTHSRMAATDQVRRIPSHTDHSGSPCPHPYSAQLVLVA